MIDNPVDIIFNSTVWFLVIWVVLAISLNIRDARKRKRLQRARQQAKTKKTVPVEQVIRLAEWNMEQWITEREKKKVWVGSSKDAARGGGRTLHTPGKCSIYRYFVDSGNTVSLLVFRWLMPPGSYEVRDNTGRLPSIEQNS